MRKSTTNTRRRGHQQGQHRPPRRQRWEGDLIIVNPSRRDRSRVKRESTKYWLAQYEEDYKQTQNPVFAWAAFSVARDHDLQIPSWVLLYLDRASNKIWEMARPKANRTIRTPKKGDIAQAVSRAFEFSNERRRGPRNPFLEIENIAHDVNIAVDVFREVNGGLALDYAFDQVAKEHPGRCFHVNPCTSLSRSTVRRIFLRHRTLLLNDPSTKGLLPHPSE